MSSDERQPPRWHEDVFLSVEEVDGVFAEAGVCSTCSKPIVIAHVDPDSVSFTARRGEKAPLEWSGSLLLAWGECEDGHLNDWDN